MKEDCIGYKGTYCSILKKLYCKNENCKFYKQGAENSIDVKEAECRKNNAKTKHKTGNNLKKQKKIYFRTKYYWHKKAKCKCNHKNYGYLEFTDEEIEKLRNKKMKIGNFKTVGR